MPSIFTPKFDLLPIQLQEKIFLSAKENGAYSTAKAFFEEAGMSEQGLYARLKLLLKERGIDTGGEKEKEVKTEVVNGKKEIKLSASEKKFLKGLESGSVTLEDASRIVASKVFEKMLRNPDDFRFIDFFRTELLKSKNAENQERKEWREQIVNRMFSGNLPPRICPNCGTELIKLNEVKVITEGEVIVE